MIDTTKYVGPKLGGVINRFMADEYRLSDIDATRYVGPKVGGVINKLLDDAPSKDLGIKMVTPFTLVLVALLGLSAVVGVYRMIFGIGAASNLNDLWPWGLWIGFDVLGGVAMAAGAFLIAAAVYILNWKKYKCIARASILNAFFGYLLAAISITLDIGRSFVIWHPLVMWQINSVMFIVALHLVLYLTTLGTESSPMVFEKLGWHRALNFTSRIMVGAVMFGVALSLLHQSSLGANYLIVPGKLSPLWYSPLLPYHFLVSAIMLGLSMVSFETLLTGKVFNHKPPRDVVEGLARGAMIIGSVYLVMKIWHLVTGPRRRGGTGRELPGESLSDRDDGRGDTADYPALLALRQDQPGTHLCGGYPGDPRGPDEPHGRGDLRGFRVCDPLGRGLFPLAHGVNADGGHDRLCDPGVQVLRQIPAPVSRVASLNTRKHLSE